MLREVNRSVVIMFKGHKGNLNISRRAIISITVVACVATLGLSIGLLANWLLNNPSSSNANNQHGVLSGLPSNPQPKAVVDAQQLDAQGKYDQAQQAIVSALADTTDSTEKYELYLEQGANFENEQQYNEAIDAYNKANAIKPSAGTYDAIGQVAQLIGNKQLAIDSYTKEIELLPPNSDKGASMKQQLEAQIKELQN